MAPGVGWIGQSNMVGVADWAKNPSPLSPAQLAKLWFFNLDWYSAADDSGIFRQQSFSPSGLSSVTSSYDYDPNATPPSIVATNGLFGPEIYGAMELSNALGGSDILNVKAATGGLYLTKSPVTAPRFNMSWFWPSAHNSWDTTVPRTSAPYNAIVRDSGVASSIATHVLAPFALLTDPSKSWVVNGLVDMWCVVGSSFGRIVQNTATTAVVEYFFPNGFGPLPPAGAYSIEQRDCFPASWAKAFIDGYCVGAKAADPSFDLQLIGIALGESDSMNRETASLSKDRMQKLIWYLRNQAVANGVTSLDAHEIGVTISLVGEIPEQPFASVVNRGYLEIAMADPHTRVVEVGDLPTGGFELFDDPFHYNAAGQVEFGKRHGRAMLELLDVASTAPRKSVHYSGRHRIVRPLWGYPAGRVSKWTSDASQIPSLGDAVDMPSAYADVDGGDGYVPIRLDGVGISWFQGEHWGYGLPHRKASMMPAEALQLQSPRRPAPTAGSSSMPAVTGMVWPAGVSSGVGFDEFELAYGQHVIYRSNQCGDKITRWSTAGVEWLRRGYCGAMGVSFQAQVDEFTGDGSTLWMRHRIGDGDSSRSQDLGRGRSKVPPSGESSLVAMEYGCDELAPYAWAPSVVLPALTADEIKLVHDHGGDSSMGDAVLWDDCSISVRVTPDWHGIAGCFRVVHTLDVGFDLGHELDRVSLQQRVFLDPTAFDRQVSYDPATSTSTAWTTVGNLTRTFRSLDHDEITPTHSLASTGPGPFTQAAGLAAYERIGGLVVGVYGRLRGAAERLELPLSLTAGGVVAAPVAPGYQDYDQLEHSYLMQTCTALGGVIRSGASKWAMFILVGDLATVQAAADELFALGVDSTWVD